MTNEEKKEKKETPAEKPAEEKKEETKASEVPKAEEVKTKEKAEKIKTEKKPVPDNASLSAKAPGDKKAKPSKPSGKYKEIIEQIEKLSVIELSELVKELEDRFGVSAVAPVAAIPATNDASKKEDETSEKTTATLHLADAGAQKIAVIKALREINPDLGLKEAKDLADGAPKDIKTDIPKEEAEEGKKKLETAGAKVELK